MQAYNSIMCGYFCMAFIGFMLKGKCLFNYINLHSPKNMKRMIK